jgi:hypothetical protein
MCITYMQHLSLVAQAPDAICSLGCYDPDKRSPPAYHHLKLIFTTAGDLQTHALPVCDCQPGVSDVCSNINIFDAADFDTITGVLFMFIAAAAAATLMVCGCRITSVPAALQ